MSEGKKPLVAEIVIDVSAFPALLNQEAGADLVAEALPRGIISAVNVTEVIAKLSEAGIPESSIQQILDPLGLPVVPFDETQASQAGL